MRCDSRWLFTFATIVLLLPFRSALGMRPAYDRIFTIAMTNDLSLINDEAMNRQWSTLAPQGDGPFIRLGLFTGNSYMADADPARNWILYPDPVSAARNGGFGVARKRDIPILFRAGAGPWMDPKGFPRPNAFSVLKTWRRNLMWYQDNRIHEAVPVERDSFTTWGPNDIQVALDAFTLRLNMSRYNREVQDLRRNLRKQSAVMVAEFYRRFPHLLAGVMLEGEMEHDPDRRGHITDYNPWSILEFRDWAAARGGYAPGGAWGGQAYVQSGRYRGDLSPGSDESGDGHTFNGDFGTAFTSWELRHFSQADFDAVSAGKSKSFTLSEKVKGGFDAPRVYKDLGHSENFPAYGAAPSGSDRFLKLWNYFRAFQIMNEYDAGMRDMESEGIPRDLIFNWIIPGSVSWYGATAGERSYLGALAPWLGRSSLNTSAGVSYYGISDSMPAFVRNLGARRWSWVEVPGNKLFNNPQMTGGVIEKYWRNGLQSMIPLVWCEGCSEQIQGFPLESAIRDFIQAHRKTPRPGHGHPATAPELTGYVWGFPPVAPDFVSCDIPGAGTGEGWLKATLAAGFKGTVKLDQDLGGTPTPLPSGDFDEMRINVECSRSGTVELLWNGGVSAPVALQAGMQNRILALSGAAGWKGDISGIGLRFHFPSGADLSLYSVQLYKRAGSGDVSNLGIFRQGGIQIKRISDASAFDALGREISPDRRGHRVLPAFDFPGGNDMEGTGMTPKAPR